MRIILVVFAIFSIGACTNSGGGGGAYCNSLDCIGGGYGNGKPTTQTLSVDQKNQVREIISSLVRARNASLSLNGPVNTNDTHEKQMIERLKSRGCKGDFVFGRREDVAVFDYIVNGENCSIDVANHSEATPTYSKVDQNYRVKNIDGDFKKLNDVIVSNSKSIQYTDNSNSSKSATEGEGTLISQKYGELKFYNFERSESDIEKNVIDIRSGFGLHMPYGLAQVTTIISNSDGKSTYECEINGELIDPILLPRFNASGQ